MGYPLMDMLLLTVAVRLAVGSGPAVALAEPHGRRASWRCSSRTPSTDGCSCTTGYIPGSGFLEIGWIAFYVGFGAAALHPCMQHLSDRAPDVDAKVGVGRLALLGAASLLAPAHRR